MLNIAIAHILEVILIHPNKDYSFKQQKVKNCVKFTIKTQNIISNEILINYLNTYPLFSSNFLNFNDFVLALEIFKKFQINNKLKSDLDNLDFPTFNKESLDLINLIKKRIHHNRTIFNWDHLKNFYNFNYC